MRYIWLTLVMSISLLLSGCTSMKIDDFKDEEPQLVLEEYFAGTTWAWGIFEDRFGNLKRSFQVKIDGKVEDDGTLVLDERFLYNDGERDQRIWRITPLGEGRYEGRAGDIVGTASGQVAGNALNWTYTMKLPVKDKVWEVQFNDWMFLQPGDVMINKADVSKWGIRLGTVTLFFSKQAPQ